MTKTITIRCYNCKETFRINIEVKEPTRGGKSEETITKTCPYCTKENTITLPDADQLGNTTSAFRGSDPEK